MPRPSKHLNDKQIRVLRWIERGCPDGEYADDNYGHRITAKALASRGLVKIEGRGKTWRAILTAAGSARMSDAGEQRGKASGAGKELLDLRHRLEEASGQLRIDARDGGIDYRTLANQFNRSEHRPHGKQLRLSSPDWGRTYVLEYQEWLWDLVAIPEVKPVGPGSRLGPLAKLFLSNRDDQFVSKDSLARASRLLEAIARQAAVAGVGVRDPRAVDERKRRNGGNVRGWSGHLELESGSAILRVQVREKPGPGAEKFDYYPDGDFNRTAYNRIQRLPAWQRNRNHTFVPTGELELRVTRPGFGFDRARWKDKKAAPLETQLGGLFQELEVARLEAAARLRREREAEEQRKLDWEAAMARARVLYRASQEEALLIEQAAIWRRQEEVRTFLEELRRRDDGSNEALRTWITTGERVMNRLDAFDALATPTFPAPTAQDLQPYLGTWNAWGPARSATPFH